MARQDIPRVAVLVDTATGWGRRLIHGIIQYTQHHEPWHLWVEPRYPYELELPPGWRGEGIIARVSTPQFAKKLTALRIPVVNISAIVIDGVNFPRVTTDVQAAAKLAAEHFLDRGFKNFGYFGTLHASYLMNHQRAFAQAVADAGGSCHVYHPGRTSGLEAQQERIARWLKGLPKPVAILSWALQGIMVLRACYSLKIQVPEEVAVLAGDEDDLLCNAAIPPLSGIAIPSETMGLEAARMLGELMRGGKKTGQSLLLTPSHVITRQSTDTLAIADADLAAAIRFIRQHAREGIDVSHVLEEVPISRRALERRFHELLGRTPADEIRRVRLERSKQLLVETDLAIPAVAAASGFGSPEYMSFAFRAALKITPRQYRQQQRGTEAHPDANS